jgi:hypothetical protein
MSGLASTVAGMVKNPEQRHGFDFCTGPWVVTNRRLVKILAGSEEWDEFTSVVDTRMVLGGTANLDEISFPTKGYHGLTLRLYDPAADEWTLNWVDSRTGRLDPPLRGRFLTPGRGEFFGQDVYEGRPIRVRFVWSATDTPNPRWEQSFQLVGDPTWELNWTMTFARP